MSSLHAKIRLFKKQRLSFLPKRQTGELDIALQNFGEYNLPLDRHPFPHPVHSRPKEQLSEDHHNPTGRQHHRKALAWTANSHVVPKSHPHSPAGPPTCETKLAGSGGRVVLSQGGENTFINHAVEGELQHLTVTQLYGVANWAQAGILLQSLSLCYKERIKISKHDRFAFRHQGCALQLVGCAPSSFGTRKSDSGAGDNRKGTSCFLL